MEDIVAYILLGVLAIAILAFVVFKAVQILRLSPEARKELLITYLKGLVALAEQEIGSGHGQEKLAKVEEYFNKKAPFIYKASLYIFGKENLRELIELALSQIKDSFEK